MFDHLAASNVSSSVCDLAAYAVLFAVILRPYSPTGRLQDGVWGQKSLNEILLRLTMLLRKHLISDLEIIEVSHHETTRLINVSMSHRGLRLFISHPS